MRELDIEQIYSNTLLLDNNPYQFSPLFHEHLHWELILTFSDKPEIQLTLGHGVNGSDIRFQFFFIKKLFGVTVHVYMEQACVYTILGRMPGKRLIFFVCLTSKDL